MPTQKKRHLYYGWIILGVCLLAVVIAYGMRFSYGVFFTSWEQDFNLNRVMISAVFSIYMLLGSLFAIIAGWTADRHGPKNVFLVMGVFTCLGLVLTSHARELWHLFISYSLLMAIGTGPAFAVATAVAAKWFESKRGLAIAIVSSGIGLGSIVIAPVAAYFMETSGWRFSSIILGAIALIIIVPPAFLLKRNTEETASRTETITSDTSQRQPVGVKADVIPEFSILKTVRTRNFALIFTLWVFYAFCLFTIMTHLVPHALDLNITPLHAVSIISVMGFTNIPARIFAGILSDKLGRKPVALVSALLMLTAMVLLLFSSNLWMLYIFAVIYGTGYGGLGSPTVAMVGDIFGARHMGIIMGLLEVGWVIGAALGPALAGYIYDMTHTYHPAFIVEVIAASITLLLVFFIRIPTAKQRDGAGL